MKKYPECGAKLESADTSSCPKCHASRETHKSFKRKKRKAPKYLKKDEKKGKAGKKGKKNKQEQAPEPPQIVDDGYDGYYDDVLPPDMDRISEGIDKELVKKIAILIAAVTFAIGICIAMLYFL